MMGAIVIPIRQSRKKTARHRTVYALSIEAVKTEINSLTRTKGPQKKGLIHTFVVLLSAEEVLLNHRTSDYVG